MTPPRHLALVLHAHLPWVKGEEAAERWLFEAVRDCYLPLIQVLRGLARDQVRAPVALSLSPTLVAGLDDAALRRACRDFLARDARDEGAGLPAPLGDLARARAAEVGGLLELFDACGQDVAAALASAVDGAGGELCTCNATHGFLPLVGTVPQAARAQVLVGAARHRARFGQAAQGFWLAECGFVPSLEASLAESGARWTVVDEHAFHQARRPPLRGALHHVFLERGVAAFARDAALSALVWDPDVGFPGHADYLELHHRVEGRRLLRVGDKAPYVAAAARDRAQEHAAELLDARAAGAEGLTLIAFDAELFGHWWAEGPVFLDALCRQLATRDDVRGWTPGGYLAAHPEAELCVPAASSWGRGGHAQTWLAEGARDLWPHLHRAAERLVRLVAAAADADLAHPAWSQAATELLLAQASDWPFLIEAGVHAALARRRVEEHLDAFARLAAHLEAGAPDAEYALERARTHNPFGQVDVRVYRAAGG